MPAAALDVCAEVLARHFDRAWCWRFPDPHWAAFGQVVLVARRSFAPVLDPAGHPVARQARAWAADPLAVPPLPDEPAPVVPLPADPRGGLAGWAIAPLDLGALLAEARPGMRTAGRRLAPLENFGVDRDLDDLIGAPQRTAAPLTPVHIAMALAAGLFNGAEIAPDDPASGLPRVLLKGVFRRERRTVEEKRDREGHLTAVVQVEKPQLAICVLDLDRLTYHDLAPGSLPTGAAALADFTVADLLAAYGDGLLARLRDRCRPLHDPGNPAHAWPLPPLALRPFLAQAHAIREAATLLAAGDNPILLGEVGSGKTLVTLATAWAFSPAHHAATLAALRARGGLALAREQRPARNVLVVMPPHLLDSWREEIPKVLPGAAVRALDRLGDVPPAGYRAPEGAGAPGVGLTFFLLSREMAKLGHGYAPGVGAARRCPRCGGRVSGDNDELALGRARCEHRAPRLLDGAATLARELAGLLATAPPDEPKVRQLLAGRYLLRHCRRVADARREADESAREALAAAAWRARALGRGDVAASPLARIAGRLVAELAARRGEDDHQLRAALRGLLHAVPPDAPGREAFVGATIVAVHAAGAANPERWGWGERLRDFARELLALPAPGAGRDALVEALRRASPDDAGPAGWANAVGVLARLDAGRRGAATVASRARTYGGYAALSSIGTRSAVDPATGALQYGGQAVGTHAAAAEALDALLAIARIEPGEPCGEPLYAATPVLAPVAIRGVVWRHRVVKIPGDSHGAGHPRSGWPRWGRPSASAALVPAHRGSPARAPGAVARR